MVQFLNIVLKWSGPELISIWLTHVNDKCDLSWEERLLKYNQFYDILFEIHADKVLDDLVIKYPSDIIGKEAEALWVTLVELINKI